MGAALGPGWGETVRAGWVRSSDEVVLHVYETTAKWWVRWADSDDGHFALVCRTPEAAVAVAHLLVAAERVAAGDEVRLTARAWDIALRVDLLRADDEAEAT